MTNISLNPRQKLYVTASAATLKLPAQEPFLRNVARILARCAQPVSMNDVILTVSLCLSSVASADVIISRCVATPMIQTTAVLDVANNKENTNG
jgi:hypothetical protein